MNQNEDKNTQPQQTRTLFSIPLSGCLMVIILSAAAGIMVNECKRSQIRLENDRKKYQQNEATRPDTAAMRNTFVLNALSQSR